MITAINQALASPPDEVALYGVILFTEANPNVIKTLKDPEYYNALHVITGDRVVVFSTMAFRGHWGHPSPPPGILARMIAIWEEPNQNKELLSTFNLKDSNSFPLMVLFDFKNESMRFCTHKINDTSPQAVFDSLSGVLMPICSADEITYESAKRAFQWASVKANLSKVISVIGGFRGAAGV